VSRARGDLDRAAALTAAGLSETTPGWSGRYAWPLAWLACRTAADRSLLARDRDRQAERIDGRPIIDAILAVQSASPAPAALAYRALSEAELLRGDGEPAESAWRSAVEAWERAGQAWPLAYARYRLAEALCAAGRGAEAIAPLHEALRVAAELGARPLQDEAGALARRARLDVTSGQGFPADIEEALAPAAESPAPFGLTDREREVLALVAAGHSNSQIARTLYISPKTASVHVSNILAKLRVGGRVEAAAVAVRWGLADPAGSAGR
jgi:DNA-binding CsgD family transcriptional regulator